MNLVLNRKRPRRGQGLVEYALILALAALVVFGALSAVGPKPAGTMNTVAGSLP